MLIQSDSSADLRLSPHLQNPNIISIKPHYVFDEYIQSLASSLNDLLVNQKMINIKAFTNLISTELKDFQKQLFLENVKDIVNNLQI